MFRYEYWEGDIYIRQLNKRYRYINPAIELVISLIFSIVLFLELIEGRWIDAINFLILVLFLCCIYWLYKKIKRVLSIYYWKLQINTNGDIFLRNAFKKWEIISGIEEVRLMGKADINDIYYHWEVSLYNAIEEKYMVIVESSKYSTRKGTMKKFESYHKLVETIAKHSYKRCAVFKIYKKESRGFK